MTPDSRLAAAFIPARHSNPSTRARASLVVIHSTEGNGSARSVADWFASASSPQASAHYVVDAHEIVQCVAERDIAWAAPGANANGISIELCGFAHWTAEQWIASGVLEKAARLVADICQRNVVPLAKLSVGDLIARATGIVGHVDVSQAFKKSDHWDPGVFAWGRFLGLCVEARSELADTDPPPAAA